MFPGLGSISLLSICLENPLVFSVLTYISWTSYELRLTGLRSLNLFFPSLYWDLLGAVGWAGLVGGILRLAYSTATHDCLLKEFQVRHQWLLRVVNLHVSSYHFLRSTMVLGKQSVRWWVGQLRRSKLRCPCDTCMC